MSRRLPKERPGTIEWPTVALYGAIWGAWAIGISAAAAFWLPLGIAVTALALVLHSSITHEVLHGHPFPSRWASEALVVVQPGLFVPYLRFRDLHLAHHMDARLTDPYDDPESNYLDPAVWDQLPRWWQRILKFNNTLAGRILIGAVLGQMTFLRQDLRAIRAGDVQALRGWLLHLPGVALVLWGVAVSAMPVWAYLGAAYLALAILRIRVFLEHQAHEHSSGRTVIIEDTGPLAFLFLNNNLHVVHHMHPRVPWYRLPDLYRANRDRYLARNGGYVFRSYGEVFRRFFWRGKDPVPHPIWPRT